MRHPISVLLMARELGAGGTERQLAVLAKSLDRTRFETHIGCFRPDGVRGTELRESGVPILHLPIRSFASPAAVITGLRRFRRYLDRHTVRVVHTFDEPMNLFGVAAARMMGIPLVLSSTRAHRNLAPGIRPHLLRMVDTIADGVIVNCDAMRRYLVEDERVPDSKIRLCYNGIDIREFVPEPRVRPEILRNAAVVVGVVCVIRWEKDLTTLLRAFKSIWSGDRSLRLVIVGSGPDLSKVEAYAREIGGSEWCHFVPATRDVVTWLRAIDIFVLPSISEALSNSLMEAMACGCTPVATGVGGNPELVRHGENGLLFSPGDAYELAACLRLLVANEPLRHRLADASVARIRHHFSVEASASRMGQIYEELLQ